MRIIGFPEQYVEMPPPVSVTVGTYDGIHLGHQALLSRLGKSPGSTVCMTFSNHPSSVLRPREPTCLICSPEQKLRLLEPFGIDLVSLFPFSQVFAELEAVDFLSLLKRRLGMDALLLGHDARLGKARAGSRDVVIAAGKQLHFSVEYLDAVHVDGEPVSSSRLRESIALGQLSQVEKLLGRPLSYFGRVYRGSGKGEALRAPTANLDVADLCIPPLGVYAVTVTLSGKTLPGVANLGVGPTLHTQRNIALEVHLLDFEADLYDMEIEVFLRGFLRPEKRFESVEALRLQIAQDIEQARARLACSSWI